MKLLKKVLALVTLTIALGTSFASAATVHVQGGIWTYFKDDGYAYSIYYHGEKWHSSTVKVGSYTASSGGTAPEKTAVASAETSWWEAEQFYYNAW